MLLWISKGGYESRDPRTLTAKNSPGGDQYNKPEGWELAGYREEEIAF